MTETRPYGTYQTVDFHLSPRPGRSYCNSVTSHDCLAPAGYRTGAGSARLGEVRKSDLYVCPYCEETVCHHCSTDFKDVGRVCDSHDEEELLTWLGREGYTRQDGKDVCGRCSGTIGEDGWPISKEKK